MKTKFCWLTPSLTCMELITPLAIPDSLPATLVTPCLTLSFTSSMSGAWRRSFGCWCPHCVSQIPSWMMEMEMLSPGSLSRSSGSASCRRPPPSLCWSTCRSWCCCCPGTCTASRYHSDVWRHLQYVWRYYRDRLASRSLLDSPPKNMSELMDLALPNLLTASELLELGPEDTGAGERLGLSMYNITIFNPSSQLPT